jgi:hypothetical protein
MRWERLEMAWLVEKPDALPLVQDEAQIFGREDQLPGTASRISRVEGNKAAGAGTQRAADKGRHDPLTHGNRTPP